MTDIPPMPRPQVTEYRVQICRPACRVAGPRRTWASSMSTLGLHQYGASAHRSGKKSDGCGITCSTMEWAYRCGGYPPCSERADRSGVEPERDHPGRFETPAKVSGGRRRTGGQRGSVRATSAVVHTDDTWYGEWVVRARLSPWHSRPIMLTMVYQVRCSSPQRGGQLPRLCRRTYAGVMVTDRARELRCAGSCPGVRQQKCLAHVLRSIS